MSGASTKATHLHFDLRFTGDTQTAIDLPANVTWADVADYGVAADVLRIALRDGRTLEYPLNLARLIDPENLKVDARAWV